MLSRGMFAGADGEIRGKEALGERKCTIKSGSFARYDGTIRASMHFHSTNSRTGCVALCSEKTTEMRGASPPCPPLVGISSDYV